MNALERPDAAAEALAAVPFLAPLAPVDLAKLAGVLEDVWFDAGTVVFEAGGAGDALYILREGVAERRVAGSRIGLIEPPEVFGDLALLTGAPRSSSVVAVTPIRAWVLPKNRVQMLLRAEPELLFDVSRAIGIELARARRALGELQRELEQWVAERMAALAPAQRAVVEAAALFDMPPPALLARMAGDATALAALAPLVQERAGRWSVPAAIRAALRRRLDAEARTQAVASRVRDVGRELERDGHDADALAAYRATGAAADAARLAARAPALAAATTAGAGDADGDRDAADGRSAAATARPRRRMSALKLAGLAAALVPLLFWNAAAPAGLTADGWRALLTLVAAAILFATDALPEAVVALGLLAVWVVGGVVPARTALDGFATQAWVLVLTVLAVGVAVGNSGLLYRIALAALGRRPAPFARRCATLALVGAAVTPTLPNATSRAALAAPMVREVADALGYAPGGRPATGLALASFVGFGQMAALFLTGSSVGLLVHGLLPAATRAEFGFAGWLVAALPLHVPLFAGALVAVLALYRPDGAADTTGDRLALQRAVLGPMRRDEKLCLAVMIALIALFMTEPWHGVHAAWVGVAALAVLAAGGALDTTMLRTGVNWPFLVFFGVITSLATVFQSLGVDAWLARSLAAPIGALAGHGLLFCLALALIGFALSFVVRWQAAAPLLALVALPVAEAAHVHPFLAALIALVATQVWFLPYQSTVYLAFHQGAGELFAHRAARPLAWLWGPLVLLAIAVAYPAWRAMGLAH
ncbi:MAG: SLC13 family permease [Burkholderiales bacterium]